MTFIWALVYQIHRFTDTLTKLKRFCNCEQKTNRLQTKINELLFNNSYMDQFQSKQWSNVLRDTRKKALSLPLGEKKYVIFSDLHMGNGGARDDFKRNAPLVYRILKDFYYPGGYHLVLNGDIEELQKFRWEQIQKKWSSHIELFKLFNKENRLTKILGNHDLLLMDPPTQYPFSIRESLELNNNDGSILIYHGHQYSEMLMRFEKFFRFVLKYMASPLGIMNYSKSPDSRKKLKTETRAYEASYREGLISIIGHTHRPLFESISKADSLKYRLDTLIRNYRKCSIYEKKMISCEIKNVQNELTFLHNSSELHISELYSAKGLSPCLFNSGCTIGKRGITGIELNRDKIKLVYWYDTDKNSQYQNFFGYKKTEIQGTSLRRITLNSEKISYIQDKIKFMAPLPFPSCSDTLLSFPPLPG